MNIIREHCLSFDDVLMVPQFSGVKSRFDVDLSSHLGNLTFGGPVISSPMDSITGPDMIVELATNKIGFGILHRYMTIEEQIEDVKEVLKFVNGDRFGVAVGTTGDFVERASEFDKLGVKILCVDVAHGHSVFVKNALCALKNVFHGHIMVGNVATREGYLDLCEWGADSVRVGIASGSICSTKIHTAHGMPVLQSVMDISRMGRPKIPIIADGGIRTTGDIVKALAAGASFVMLGQMLAGTNKTPGDLITSPDGKVSKVYRGMASFDAQKDWRGYARSVEGVATTVPFKGETKDVLEKIRINVASGCSYAGAFDLDELREKAVFRLQTQGSYREGEVHVKDGKR